MSNVAYLPIEVDRYTACVRQIRVVGLDLTGVAMRAQVRLGGDTPGAPLADLLTVTNGNAQGLRLVSVTTAAGVPTSAIELVINETTMEGLPYAGELGAKTALAWDLHATLSGRKQRMARGEFIITGDGVTGADNAPTSRPQGFSSSSVATSGMRTGATLTFGDEVSTVVIDGADLVAPYAASAKTDAAAAKASSDAASQSAAAAAGFVGGVLYATTAAGLAATAEGRFFTVVGDGTNTYAILYRKVSGAAVEQARYVSKAGFDASMALKVDNTALINVAAAKAVSASTILQAADLNTTIACGAGSARYQITLPPASAADIGKAVRATIARDCLVPVDFVGASSSGALVDGRPTATMICGEVATFVFEGTAGWVREDYRSIELKAEMRRSAALALPPDTFTAVPFATPGTQLMAQNLSGQWGAAGGHFTAPRPSTYLITACVWLSGLTGAPGQIDIGVYAGSTTGGEPGDDAFDRLNVTTGTFQKVRYSRMFSLNTGDKLFVCVRPLGPLTAGSIAAGVTSTIQIVESLT